MESETKQDRVPRAAKPQHRQTCRWPRVCWTGWRMHTHKHKYTHTHTHTHREVLLVKVPLKKETHLLVIICLISVGRAREHKATCLLQHRHHHHQFMYTHTEPATEQKPSTSSRPRGTSQWPLFQLQLCKLAVLPPSLVVQWKVPHTVALRENEMILIPPKINSAQNALFLWKSLNEVSKAKEIN